jgi:hypothetical protein
LQAQLNELHRDIARLNEDIKQKDATILERGIKIETVKKENQELEKYHQVLNHQENQLHSQMDPLERQIERETHDISAMDGSLESAHRTTTTRNETIAEMQAALRAVIEEERAQTARLQHAKTYFEQMKCDLHEVVQHFHAKDELKTLFMSFHNKYMRTERVEDIRLDEDVESEHQRQRAMLETQLRELRHQHTRDETFQVRQQGTLLRQNAALIEELQELRVQHRQLQLNASMVARSPRRDADLLPATEAARRIEENKRIITRLEGQLAQYSEKERIVSPRKIVTP